MSHPLISGQLGGLCRVDGRLRCHSHRYIRVRFVSARTAYCRQEHGDAVTRKSEKGVTRGKLLVRLSRGINFVGIEQREWRFRNVPRETNLVRRDYSHTGCRKE